MLVEGDDGGGATTSLVGIFPGDVASLVGILPARAVTEISPVRAIANTTGFMLGLLLVEDASLLVSEIAAADIEVLADPGSRGLIFPPARLFLLTARRSIN